MAKGKIILVLFVFVFGLLNSYGWTKDNFVHRANVERYLNEFFPPGIGQGYPKIYQAVRNVFMKLPESVFNEVSKRQYPILITINITSGIGRFANSSQVTLNKKDHTTFREGFYLIKLSDELENTPDGEAIEGILFHELGHRYLNHLRQSEFSCEMEREANRLVKKWGFEKEYKKAKQAFGSKTPTDSPCRDQVAPANPA